MVRDAAFNKAVSCLAGMEDKQLALACAVVKMGQKKAELDLSAGENRNIAMEMAAMYGETAKEMVRRLVRKEGKAPGGLTEDEAIAQCDKETDAELKRLEAA